MNIFRSIPLDRVNARLSDHAITPLTRLTAPEMAAQTLQDPKFSVLWCYTPHSERLAPLQIRSFTSDSYRAIKARERKRRPRWNKTNPQRLSNAQKKDVIGDSVSSMDTALEPSPAASTSDSVDLQKSRLVDQDDGRAQSDVDAQHLPAPLDPASMKTLETLFGNGLQCLPAPPSAPAPHASVSGRLEPTSGMEVNTATLPEEGHDTSVVSEDGSSRTFSDGYTTVPMQAPDDHVLTRSESVVAIPSPSTPVPCSAAFHDHGRFERQSHSHDTEPSLESIVHRTRDFSPSIHIPGIIPDGPIEVLCTVGNVAMCNYRATSKPACSSLSIPSSQVSWTSEQDKRLLHLHDVAQLEWRDVAAYFPHVTLSAAKYRYQQLQMTKNTRKAVSAKRVPRNGGRTVAASLASSRGTAELKATKQYHATPRTVTPLAKISAPSRGAGKQVNDVKNLSSPGVSARDKKVQATRCGRQIKHPFRHRLSEGYV